MPVQYNDSIKKFVEGEPIPPGFEKCNNGSPCGDCCYGEGIRNSEEFTGIKHMRICFEHGNEEYGKIHPRDFFCAAYPRYVLRRRN